MTVTHRQDLYEALNRNERAVRAVEQLMNKKCYLFGMDAKSYEKPAGTHGLFLKGNNSASRKVLKKSDSDGVFLSSGTWTMHMTLPAYAPKGARVDVGLRSGKTDRFIIFYLLTSEAPVPCSVHHTFISNGEIVYPIFHTTEKTEISDYSYGTGKVEFNLSFVYQAE